jgi:hypothetical protein
LPTTSSHSFAAENGKATPFMKCIIEKLFQPVGCFVVFLKNLQLGKPVQRATSWQGETPSQNYPPILGKSLYYFFRELHKKGVADSTLKCNS